MWTKLNWMLTEQMSMLIKQTLMLTKQTLILTELMLMLTESMTMLTELMTVLTELITVLTKMMLELTKMILKLIKIMFKLTEKHEHYKIKWTLIQKEKMKIICDQRDCSQEFNSQSFNHFVIDTCRNWWNSIVIWYVSFLIILRLKQNHHLWIWRVIIILIAFSRWAEICNNIVRQFKIKIIFTLTSS